MEQLDAEAIRHICQAIGCNAEDIEAGDILAGGLTNTSWLFAVDGVKYVYRRPGAGTDEIINRKGETFAQGIARDLGVDRTFVYEDELEGWKISRFIEGCIPFNYHNRKHVEQAMALARELHGSDATSPWSFDVYQKAVGIIELLEDTSFPGLDERIDCAEKLAACVKADGVEPVLCHNDFYEPNFLVHGEGMELIDWEYSAMADYASDLGTFICCSDYGIPEAEDVIRLYFQREPTPEEMRHCMAYVGLCAFYWFVWALYKEQTGDPVGDWLQLWNSMAESFGSYALSLY